MTSTSPPSLSDVPDGASPEQLAPVADGIELCYQTFGDPADEPAAAGDGARRPDDLVEPGVLRAARGGGLLRDPLRQPGHRPVQPLPGPGQPPDAGAELRAAGVRAPRPPYTLDDLAGDAFALLDHLGLDSAHIVGVSMGGMIVQTMALLHPERVRSMTSIMSTTGRRTVGWQDPRLLPLLLARSVQTGRRTSTARPSSGR